VPIDYGAKITGKAGKYNLGFLQVQTRKLGDTNTSFGIPRQHFTVARVKRDILERSYVGAMFVNREGATSANGTRYNRAAGIDAEFNLTDHYQLKAFVAGTATPGLRGSVLGARIDSRFENNLWRLLAVYEDNGTNFNPEVGFVERPGIRQYFGQLAYKPRPQFIPHVRQMEFETQVEYYADRSGNLSTRQTEISWETQFRNSAVFFFRPLEDVTDVLTEPFRIRPGIVIPPGSYRFNRPRVSFTSDASKASWVVTTRYQWGDFYISGKRDEVSEAALPSAQPAPACSISVTASTVCGPASGRFHSDESLHTRPLQLQLLLAAAAFDFRDHASQFQAARLSVIQTCGWRSTFYRPNSDFFVHCTNQSTGAGLERPYLRLQFQNHTELYVFITVVIQATAIIRTLKRRTQERDHNEKKRAGGGRTGAGQPGSPLSNELVLSLNLNG
jgi:hypothetical protein